MDQQDNDSQGPDKKRGDRRYQNFRKGINDFFQREAGPHDSKKQKKKERKIKEALHKLDLDELDEL